MPRGRSRGKRLEGALSSLHDLEHEDLERGENIRGRKGFGGNWDWTRHVKPEKPSTPTVGSSCIPMKLSAESYREHGKKGKGRSGGG